MAPMEISTKMALEHAFIITAVLRLSDRAGPSALSAFASFLEDIHHAKEEKFLFPAMEKRGMKLVVDGLVADHNRGRLLEKELASALQSNSPNSFSVKRALFYGLLKQHISKESRFFSEFERKIDEREAAGILAGFGQIDASKPLARQEVRRLTGL